MFEVVFGTALSIVGLGFFVAVATNFVFGLRSRNWPTLRATILATNIKQVRINRYVPIVRYRYAVSGCNYEGARMMFGYFATPDSAGAERVLSGFGVGSVVDIRVSPAKAQRSVIVPGID